MQRLRSIPVGLVLLLLVLAGLPALTASRPAIQAQQPTATPAQRQPDHHKVIKSAPVPPEEFSIQAMATCTGGAAAGYPCKGIDYMSRVAITTMSASATAASNLWGYVDLDDNREYAIIGLNTGTSVVEVTDPANPRVVGFVTGVNSQWRELKVYQFRNQATARWDAYAYITTEGANGGIQIIDLSNLPTSVSLANTWRGVSTSHTALIGNIDWSTSVANNPSFPPILYVNGANKNGIRLVSLADPLNLQQLGAWEVNYAHDIYSHVFTDARAGQCQAGRTACEVVFNFSGNSGLQVIDVTNKASPTLIGSVKYPNLGYTHSGWISRDGLSLFLMDELDEQRLGINTLMRTVNISNLRAPALSGGWTGPGKAVEHNGYTIGNKYYMSHYTRGLVVLDVTSPTAPRELAYFDTYPTSDGSEFAGAWGVYPYLPSGTIIISDIQRGLMVVREQAAPPATATRTPTAGAPTATRTRTATTGGPTVTRTRTPTGPTATRTRTATSTALVNRALNKPATSDSACNTNETAPKAVNGSVSGGTSDKWCSLGATKWLRVDLGASYTLTRFVVKHAGAGGESTAYNTSAFTIQTSPDGTTWTTVVTVSGNTASTTTHTIAARSARYVRLNVTTGAQSGQTNIARIYELEVY